MLIRSRWFCPSTRAMPRGMSRSVRMPRPHGVVNVVVDVGNLVGFPDDLPFQSLRHMLAGVAQDAHAHLVGQVQPPAVLFQDIHHPQGLLIVAEGPAHHLAQGVLPGMAEGSVAQVVAQGDGLGQILVQPQGPGDGPGNPGNLQGVGHPGAVVIPFRRREYLGFVHHPAEGLAVDNPVGVPLVAGAHIVCLLRLRPGTAFAPVGKGCPGVQPLVFLLLQHFPNGHDNSLPTLGQSGHGHGINGNGKTFVAGHLPME